MSSASQARPTVHGQHWIGRKRSVSTACSLYPTAGPLGPSGERRGFRAASSAQKTVKRSMSYLTRGCQCGRGVAAKEDIKGSHHHDLPIAKRAQAAKAVDAKAELNLHDR